MHGDMVNALRKMIMLNLINTVVTRAHKHSIVVFFSLLGKSSKIRLEKMLSGGKSVCSTYDYKKQLVQAVEYC